MKHLGTHKVHKPIKIVTFIILYTFYPKQLTPLTNKSQNLQLNIALNAIAFYNVNKANLLKVYNGRSQK